jgi:hypothetical protein
MLAEKQTGEGIVPTADFVDQPLLQKEGRFEVDHPQQTDVERGGIPPFRRLSRRKVGHLGASPADRSQPKFNFVLGDVISCTDSTNLIRVFGQRSILAKRRKPNNGPQTVRRRGRTPSSTSFATSSHSMRTRVCRNLTETKSCLIVDDSCFIDYNNVMWSDHVRIASGRSKRRITSQRRTSDCHRICARSHIGCFRYCAKIRFSTIFPKIYLINCIGLCRLGGSC